MCYMQSIHNPCLFILAFGGIITYTGLAAYIFTTSMPRSWRVSEALEYGLVGVNEGLISTEVMLLLHKCFFVSFFFFLLFCLI